MLKKFVEEKTQEIIDALFKLQDAIKNDGLRVGQDRIIFPITSRWPDSMENHYYLERTNKTYIIWRDGFVVYECLADQPIMSLIGQIVMNYLSQFEV